MERVRAERWLVGALCLAAVGSACSGPNGFAHIEGELALDGCVQEKPRTFGPYGFDAGYLATERFAGVLLIYMQKYPSEIEETDGLTVRVDLDDLMDRGLLVRDQGRAQIVRADPAKPLVVRTSTAPSDANVSLSLFSTCAGFPTSYAIAGRLTFDKLTLAADPKDTGDDERLGGTLTATIGRASSHAPVGNLRATFDFAPPTRPLTDFK